jgi:aspartyl aminopeptidase
VSPPDILSDLLAYLGASPTPYHAVANAVERLAAAGFGPLDERDAWENLAAGRYYVVHEDSALAAFIVPEKRPLRAFRIVGAHTDSPNLRLKPRPEYEKEGYRQLGVEVYGGVLLNSWLDRDLSLAGRVHVRERGELHSRLVRLDKPRLRVAQLAIHLDRDVNEKGLVLNRQEHLAPIVGLAGSEGEDLVAICGRALGVDPASIVNVDLMLYDTVPPALGGAKEELIFSARLDNLASCHAAIVALAHAAPTDLVPLAALFDHEEVGSQSATGAQSAFLPRLIQRLVRATGGGPDDVPRALASSMCISADMAHAVHPNYADRHEARHKPVLNGGPVLKVNSQQRYATSARTAALFTEICRAVDVPLQTFVTRTDLPCGSTIGPITATLLGIPTADVGNPMLSMHSCRELAGAKDAELMTRVLSRFYVT